MEMSVSPLAEGVVKVTLEGRLDAPAVDHIETRFLASLVPGGHRAVVDMSHVDFVASMGIRMLMSAARSLQMKQAKLALFGVQERVQQVFETVALPRIIPVCATEADALAAVEGSTP